MNEKISFPDLVGLLSSKMNITKKEAETFLKEFFTVSTEIITSGEELRINGLGLFKPIWVEARGSINIQTGEPVEIPDRKSTRLNSSHWNKARMPSSA